jgi:hypothetical protein
MLYACEDIDECSLTGLYRLSRLRDLGVTLAQAQKLRKPLTESKTSMATKMSFAGDKTFQISK